MATRPKQPLATVRRGALATALLAALLFTGPVSSAGAADRVYWVNGPANTISFANLDGSGGGNLSTAGATASTVRGLAIDVAGGRIYWTNRSANRISFTNLDGSGGGGDLNTLGATVSQPNAAAVYPAAGRIYWANEGGGLISFANLDNSGGGNLLNTSLPIGPAVYPEAGRIYWGNAGTVYPAISFANLDGSGVQVLNTTGASVTNPHGVAIDPVAGKVYWANVGPTSTYAGNGIAWANLDGSGGGNFYPLGATVDVPIGVAIDPVERKIFWANYQGNKISYANLDGSGGGDLPTPGVTPAGARSAVLLKAPVATGAPTVTGGSGAGAALTCSPGSWAQDLLGSWLYRAPQRLTYAWTRDGADVPGASSGSHQASVGGDYRCRVTASNQAGSSAQTSAPHRITAAGGGPGAGSSPSRAFGKKTRVSLNVVRRHIRGRGPIKVVVRNENRFKVAARFSARAANRRLAARSFAVAAHTRKTVAVRLSKAMARRKLSVRLALKVTDPAGHTRTVRKSVVLKVRRG